MRVPQTIRDSVVYIYDTTGLLGTGFLVGVPLDEGSDRVFLYVITAKHLVDYSSSVIVSLNGRSGEAIKIATEKANWWFSANAAADVAIAFLPGNADAFSPTCVRFDQLGDDEWMAQRDVGPGDEVIFTGLLQGLPGKDRNRPIIRFGQIAMMNEELIPQETIGGDVQDIDAIMVEARSWGGHSGAPAYVVFSPTRYMGTLELVKQPVVKPRTAWALLGLVAGHWELPARIRLRNQPRGDNRDRERDALVNAGIALVVPAQHIVDLLMRDDVLEHRERMRRQESDLRPVAVQDSIQEPREQGLTQAEFRKALRRVSRKQSSRPARSKRRRR